MAEVGGSWYLGVLNNAERMQRGEARGVGAGAEGLGRRLLVPAGKTEEVPS